MRFLSIGEAMVELAPLANESEFKLGFAGDTFNTAWYLARLAPAAQVSYFTAVGDDSISAQMRSAIRDAGVDDSFIKVDPTRSVGLYMISLNNGERSFSYWRGQSAARRMVEDEAVLLKALAAHDLIFLSGITLAVLEQPGRDRLIELLGQARSQGKIIAFDPNLRPRLWANDQEMTSAIMDAAAVSDIALPSFEDEAQYFGDASPQATLERYQKAGATTVIVKDGADPVLFQSPDESGSYAVPPIAEVVDTTAAGDSFNAGVFAGLMSRQALSQGVEIASKLAGKVVQSRGALVADAVEMEA